MKRQPHSATILKRWRGEESPSVLRRRGCQRQLLPKLSAARKQKLISAQQAWIKFRDSSCEFERSAYEGGSMAPMIYGFCLADVTEQRTKDLQRYLEVSDR